MTSTALIFRPVKDFEAILIFKFIILVSSIHPIAV